MIPTKVLRQRWTRLGGIVCAAAAVLVLVLAIVGVKTLAHSKAGRRASTLPAAQSLPDTPAALLAVRAGSGALVALVVLAKAPPGANGASRGGYLIALPAGSGVQLADNPSLSRLAELYLAGGVQALAEQAGNLLSLNFAIVAEVDAAAAAQLLMPVGTVTVKQSQGVRQLGAVDAAAMLTTQTSRLESAHFESTVAYWTALAARVGKGLKFTGSQTTGAITRFFDSLLSGPISVLALRGTFVPKGVINPNGSDLYQLDASAVVRVMGIALPNAYSPVDVQFTARIVNLTGDVNLTLKAIGLVRNAGGGVTVVDETKGVVPTKTEFSLSGRLERADVKVFGDKFGVNTFVTVTGPGTRHMRYADIDLTIVIGSGFVQLSGVKSS